MCKRALTLDRGGIIRYGDHTLYIRALPSLVSQTPSLPVNLPGAHSWWPQKGTNFLLQRTIIQLKNHYYWIHHIPKEPCWQHSSYGIWIVHKYIFLQSYATFSLQWVPFFVVTQYLVALVYKNVYNEMPMYTTTTTGWPKKSELICIYKAP